MLGKSTLGRILVAVGLGALALTASACNTVQGVGEDIQSVGQEGQDVMND